MQIRTVWCSLKFTSLEYTGWIFYFQCYSYYDTIPGDSKWQCQYKSSSTAKTSNSGVILILLLFHSSCVYSVVWCFGYLLLLCMLVNSFTWIYFQEHLYFSHYTFHLSSFIVYKDNELHTLLIYHFKPELYVKNVTSNYDIPK